MSYLKIIGTVAAVIANAAAVVVVADIAEAAAVVLDAIGYAVLGAEVAAVLHNFFTVFAVFFPGDELF
jgi:hypothetical protein